MTDNVSITGRMGGTGRRGGKRVLPLPPIPPILPIHRERVCHNKIV